MFFNPPVTYFLEYFRAIFREILMSGSRERGVSSRSQFFTKSGEFFSTNYACVAFDWILSFASVLLIIAQGAHNLAE